MEYIIFYCKIFVFYQSCNPWKARKQSKIWGKIEKYCWQSKNISHPRYPWWLSCISHQYKILGSRSISHIQPITITLISNFEGKLKNIVNTTDKYISCEISMVVIMYQPPIHPKYRCKSKILVQYRNFGNRVSRYVICRSMNHDIIRSFIIFNVSVSQVLSQIILNSGFISLIRPITRISNFERKMKIIANMADEYLLLEISMVIIVFWLSIYLKYLCNF